MREFDSTIIVRDVNTPLISMDRSDKISKEIFVLNDTLDQMDLIAI